MILDNDSLIVPIIFSTEPGILEYTPATVSLELYVNEGGEEEIVTLSNNGGYPINWSAELQMDDGEVRDLSNQLDPSEFRAQWRDQMIDRQTISPERQAELEKRLDKSGHDVLQGTVATDSPNSGLLSGEFILPPEAHRSRNGSTMIAVLMDDADYVWNTMDALANYYTDYVLNEVYTNWDSKYP